ncbi:ABC transporter permease [Streptomyces iranensis]|uniref:ABC-type dipeptide/oligopeptide/nickel transportsystem, permease component n=1 Tax=Streptomyces iranensis TaxID=576784 RepID=A0A061A5S0_9ACTN|nr:ABC transporter permease [Streptomyces iranensis]MBP2064577.1 peptide/nickel transport system permease protein [Streptomyces iranensis]CDR12816.1 ABC-type dipeptide/oligopeptide/nickel transportsystem, permease component [Streptomyces iranensis]
MPRYLVQRLLQAVFVLWAAFTTSFVVLYLLPGDPVSIMASGGGDTNDVSPEQIAGLKRVYGFDKPLIEQYGDRLFHALQGDFGISVQNGDPVTRLIADQLPATLQLTSAALLLATAVGAGVALAATYTRRRWLRQALLSLPALGVSAPTFWVGLILVQVVSFRWGLLPAIGNEGFQSLILPAITLAVPASAVIAQVFAKSLRTALAEPYVETALAKGASRRRVHFGHALRNAAAPPLTVAGMLVGNLLAGSVIVETVFSRTGVGRVTATAVTAQDIPVVQGLVVFGALAFVLANLAVDLIIPLLDPRITGAAAPAVTR